MEKSGNYEIAYVGLYKLEKQVVNGVNVNFVGVDHTPKFLENNFDSLEKAVHSSALVILETEPFDRAGLEFNDGLRFYRGIADIARETPGKISVVDPYNSYIMLFQNLLEVTAFTYAGKSLASVVFEEPKFSRRNLLKSFGAIGVASSVLKD